MLANLFGLPKKEPVMVLAVAGLLVQIAGYYGVKLAPEDVQSVLGAIVQFVPVLVAAWAARQRVSPVASTVTRDDQVA